MGTIKKTSRTIAGEDVGEKRTLYTVSGNGI
jgi:hypothetical protein